MKSLRFLSVLLLALSLNLFADSDKIEKSAYLMYTNSTVVDSEYNSADIGLGIKYLKSNGLLIGADMGYEFGSGVYAYKIEALVGYHHDWFQIYPILGIEQLELDDLSYSNYIYGLGVDFRLNKVTALVVKYESNNLKNSRGPDIDYDSGSLGLRLKF